jgi:hypothetical protein
MLFNLTSRQCIGSTKYHRGLTRRQNRQRKESATRRAKMSWKNPKAYVPWKSDKGVQTKTSSYTARLHKSILELNLFPK